ncbi:Thiolase N-terminal domain-containing protein [Penicillium chermesinum]|uniref:Thiolase N-terminal domain-containing protein n=1 Tax=Penicillium chermesinum TaxID=63820 RepID=A0A9W9TWM6_9EURO|nr:Thiolase N-terminal domain-containing protein [Penicillium chermesinum]KAJ5246052.1 Thiolase N-terminal domain-containing protein [Penicillium chermesinum]KAJ6144347.1 Thiolase N-terminal domain-containing protein [Penicillium chermesinum]
MLKRTAGGILSKSPNDVVVLSAVRSPITRAFKGGFKDAYPEDILMPVMQAAVQRANIEAGQVDDVLIGNVLAELGFAKTGRMALNAAGFPNTTTFHTVNRQCSSSLQAITHVAHAILAGQIDVGLGGGAESMSRNYGTRGIPVDVSPALTESPNKDARDCLLPMLKTSENVASRYGIGRREQDEFAAESQRRATDAQRSGRFTAEIAPVTTRVISTGIDEESVQVVDRDEGIRQNVTVNKLGTLKPVLDGGSSTAGNSSQISDGASSTILARRSWAEAQGLKPIARFAGTKVAGCAPDEMGIGPIFAIQDLLKYLDIEKSDVDIFEMNEAFASQSIHCIRELGLDMAKVNPNGGAIALGHPIGATGARQTATLLAELQRQDKELGIVSMCASTGMGVASLFIREG